MLPHVSWTELVPLDTRIAPRELTHANGNISNFELEVITRLVAFHQPRILFEIGTFDGRTALNMAAHAAPDARVFTLDLPPQQDAALPLEVGDRLFIDKPRSGARFVGSDMEPRITQLYGDSGTFDFGPWAKKADFIFVDGSHSYEYVLSDSLRAFEMAAPGAVILWHDYVPEGPTPWPGVTRALHEMAARDSRFAGLRCISRTTIAHLQVPGGQVYQEPLLEVFGDSSQPERLLADLSVSVEHTQVAEGEPLLVRASIRNIGRASWLPEGSAGPVRLGVRVLDEQGQEVGGRRAPLPTTAAIQPGGAVSLDAKIDPPPKGSYTLVFDMVADGVTWFASNGSRTIRVPLRVGN